MFESKDLSGEPTKIVPTSFEDQSYLSLQEKVLELEAKVERLERQINQSWEPRDRKGVEL